MKRKSFVWLPALVLLTFLLAACAGSNAPAPTEVIVETETSVETEAPVETEPPMVETEMPQSTEAPMVGINLPEVDPAAVMGDIISAGSSTVFPLAEAIAVLFENEGYTGKITIDSIGTGAGFERFCQAGETDVANASRPIKEEEVQNCAALTPPRTPIEFRVGTDALVVVVSNENDFIENLTSKQLALAFSTAQTWADLDPAFPAEPILRYSPGTDSGTFDYFVEAIMTPANGDDEDAGKAAILESEGTQFSEDDNVLVQGVEGSPYAIGYFGYAYYQENQDRLKALSVDGVVPTEETAESNEYPLSRPLFIYSDAGVMQAKPQVADYINFFLTNVNEVILDVGYFPASGEALDLAKQAWLDAMGQ